jgi:type I restriction enzyme R subunit
MMPNAVFIGFTGTPLLKKDKKTSLEVFGGYTPGRRALYNNLKQDKELALRIDSAVRNVRPDDWRGIQPRENTIKRAMYDVLQDQAEVERIFLIVKQQREY